MKDRVPLYPGRVKLTPVSGKENTYDMVRSDEPTQEGTPLNKASLLKDTTAALFGLGTDAVPDDALALLSRFQKGLGNEYVWGKAIREPIYKVGEEKQENTVITFSDGSKYVSYSDTYIYNENTGSYSLNNPVRIHASSSNSDFATAISTGKYFKFDETPENEIYYRTQGGYEASSGNITLRSVKKYYREVEITPAGTIIGYVNSQDPNAYPPAESDGYTYTALGQLGNKVQIATGSYTGTGTYGSSNPNSLTFDFVPRLVVITGQKYSFNDYYNPAYAAGIKGTIIPQFLTSRYTNRCPPYKDNATSNAYTKKSSDGKTIIWYNSSADYQINELNVTYTYIAFG